MGDSFPIARNPDAAVRIRFLRFRIPNAGRRDGFLRAENRNRMDNQKTTFESLNLSEPILRAVRAAGYETPSPIQALAVPKILEGRDVFGCAQTGTGKTAAFALPIMQMLEAGGAYPKARRFRALILTPTRELAEQIDDNIAVYGKHLHLSHCKVYGGVSQNPQIKALSVGVDILVATPGRLLDLWKQKKLEFGGVEYLVLDEADRMLDMGFIPDIRRIVAQLPEQRQSLLFSATLSGEIRELASSIVKDPVNISVSPDSPTVEKIDQSVAFLEPQSKTELLADILKRRAEGDPKSLALVFCRTKHGANKLAKKLNSRGIGAAAIHGNKSQSARRRALEDFKERKIGALVATDIAARGIDVKDMSLVVNFDLPEEPETYVHRIGRTARAEASGMAVSFCTPDDGDLLAQILRYIKRDIPEFTENPYRVEPPKFARPGDSRRGGARRGGASRRGAGGGGSKGRASGKSGARNPRPPKRSGGERGGSRAGAPRNSDSRNSGLGGSEKKSASKPSKLGGIFGLMGFGRKGR